MQENQDQLPQEEDVKGVEMEADFEGQMEDVPPNDDSDSGADDQGDEDRLQQEMGDTGDAGETVDERLWGNEDKPEEDQQGPEKKERDSTVQVSTFSCKSSQSLRNQPSYLLHLHLFLLGS